MATQNDSPVNESEVRKNLKNLDAQIDALLPHLNKAHTAFGGLEDQLATLTDLKNKVAKARAIYGA